MFSKGQLIFTILFIISFVIILIISYQKDKKAHFKNYKGIVWVLVGFLLFLSTLFIIKYSIN